MKQKLIEIITVGRQVSFLIEISRCHLIVDGANNRASIENVNNTVNQVDLITVYRTVQPTKAEYNYFEFSWDDRQDRTYSEL